MTFSKLKIFLCRLTQNSIVLPTETFKTKKKSYNPFPCKAKTEPPLNNFQDIWAAYLRKYTYNTLLIDIEKYAKISESLPMLRIEFYYLLFQLTFP